MTVPVAAIGSFRGTKESESAHLVAGRTYTGSMSKPMSHWGYDDDGNPLPMLLVLAVGIVVAGVVIAELLR